MSDLKDKLIETITKLIHLTQENQLMWSGETPPTKLFGEDILEIIFMASDKDRNLRLYSRSYKIINSPTYGVVIDSQSKTVWFTDIILEIMDDEMNPVWRFPSLPSLSDLLAAVKYQVTGANSFTEDI